MDSIVAGGAPSSQQRRPSIRQSTRPSSSRAAAPRSASNTNRVNATAVSTAPPTIARMTPRLLDRAVTRINNALQVLGEFSGNTTIVCDATMEEWNAFVESEDQVVKSKFMVWCADEKQILWVDFPSKEHEYFVMAFHQVFVSPPGIAHYILGQGASYNNANTRPRYEPDLSYGPVSDELAPLGVVPPEGDWDDYSTLKVEIGYSIGWGHARGTLDWKARTVWSEVPGVEYVMCVKVEKYFASASYKLYSIQQTGHSPPYIANATPILPPATAVQFDTILLLGAQPPGFPPVVSLDLYAVLTLARRGRRPPPPPPNAPVAPAP